jgi:hypothetical protein
MTAVRQVRYPADLRHYVLMGGRYRAPGGWTVDVVHLSGTPDHRDGEWLRVSLHGFHVANVRTPAELEQWFPLAELEPDGPLVLAARSAGLSTSW